MKDSHFRFFILWLGVGTKFSLVWSDFGAEARGVKEQHGARVAAPKLHQTSENLVATFNQRKKQSGFIRRKDKFWPKSEEKLWSLY